MEKKYLMMGKTVLTRDIDTNEYIFYIPKKYHISKNDVSEINLVSSKDKSVIRKIDNNGCDDTPISISLREIMNQMKTHYRLIQHYKREDMEKHKTITSILNDLVLELHLSDSTEENFNCISFTISCNILPIDVLVVESPDKNYNIPFKGIESKVKQYTLDKYKTIRDITENGRLLTVLASDVDSQVTPAFDVSKYKIILEDSGDVGVPGCNCLDSAKLVYTDMNRVVSEISVSGYGIDLAIHSLMETYKFMYLADLLLKVQNESYKKHKPKHSGAYDVYEHEAMVLSVEKAEDVIVGK